MPFGRRGSRRKEEQDLLVYEWARNVRDSSANFQRFGALDLLWVSLPRPLGLGQTWDNGISFFSCGALRLRSQGPIADLVCYPSSQAGDSKLIAFLSCLASSREDSSSLVTPLFALPSLTLLLDFGSSARHALSLTFHSCFPALGPDLINCSLAPLCPSPEEPVCLLTPLFSLQACELLEAKDMPHSCLCPLSGPSTWRSLNQKLAIGNSLCGSMG